MFKSLPPLNAVRTFDAAARHGSFRMAAQELHVTPGAVSQQIKMLEEWLDVRLFDRGVQGVSLTQQGEAFFHPLTEAFRKIDTAAGAVMNSGLDRSLSITTIASLATQWLVPRLERFRAAHPDVAVRIDTTRDVVDLARAPFDLGIRYGRGVYPGLHTVELMTEDLLPVCSPRLLEQGKPLHRPEDLAQHTLLHEEDYSQWQRWLAACGVEGVNATAGMVFTDSSVVLRAAVGGLGVALCRSRLAESELADGRLIRPFEGISSDDLAYYVVCLEARKDDPLIAAFRDWLLAEAALPVPESA